MKTTVWTTAVSKTALWIGFLVVALTACGGAGSDNGKAVAPGADLGSGGPASVASGGSFDGEPVQLTVDPCELVTQAEAEQVIGLPVTQGLNGTVCTYVATGNGGLIAVETQAPAFCELLFLALDQNMFGGDQVRVDDVGDGAMLVKGNGNVQFVVDGGCISVEASVGDKSPPDDTMLSLARTAASRATG